VLRPCVFSSGFQTCLVPEALCRCCAVAMLRCAVLRRATRMPGTIWLRPTQTVRSYTSASLLLLARCCWRRVSFRSHAPPRHLNPQDESAPATRAPFLLSFRTVPLFALFQIFGSTRPLASFVTAVLSNNLHEIHGYNRLASIARGDVRITTQKRSVSLSCLPDCLR
jgi:hypothetical protein